MVPPFAIVDSHAHLYDPAMFNYPWLNGVLPLKKAHLIADYVESIRGVLVEKIVFVEVAVDDASSLDEAAWVGHLAKIHPLVRGLVASAPLELGRAVRPHLEELAQHPPLRGIRRIASAPFQSDPDFYLRRPFIEGVKLLPDYGLTFDLGVQRQDLPKALELVRNCPDVRFVLNHMANPAIGDGLLDPWAADIRALAGMENVFCKISGQIPNAGFGWTPQTLKPYIEIVLEAFGFRRSMFGSDWPLTNLNGGSYLSWVEAVWEIVRGASDSEKQHLFRETASRFYNL